MFKFRFDFILSLLLVTSSRIDANLSSAPTTSATTKIYINNQIGRDSVTCQNRTNPCKTLWYAWQKMLEMNATDSVHFSLTSPGFYEPTIQTGPSSLFFNCGQNRIKDISIQAENDSSTIHSENNRVKIGRYSFTLSLCSTQFTGLTFVASSNITTTEGQTSISHSTFQSFNLQFLKTEINFNNIIFTNITSSTSSNILILRANQVRIIKSNFQTNSLKGVQSLLAIDSVNDVDISDCEAKNNFGDSDSSLITITNSNQVRLRKIIMHNNDNILISIRGSSSKAALQNLTVDRMEISQSVNTTLQVDNMNVRMSKILIEHDTDKNRPIVSLHECEADFQNVTVECVKKNNFERSPISVDSLTNVKCNNCSTLNCKDICGEGYGIVKNILCEQCSKGRSAHDWEKICHECHPGYYSPKPGAVDCTPCQAGEFCKRRGCTKCEKCGGDLFTSGLGSSSCSQMTTFFIAMVGVALLLIMTPIAIKIICRKKEDEETQTLDDDNGEMDETGKSRYARFENQPSADKSINNNSL